MFPNLLQNLTPAHFLFSIFLFYTFAFSYQQACNPQDQSSLHSFFANLSISYPSPPLNWSSSISCCQWEGVECNVAGKVTHLQLPSRGLQGFITSSVNNLIELTHLNLSHNYLNGTLEEGVSRLTNLRILDLSSNNFFGFIPQEIGNLQNLVKLHLDSNNLSGLIPSSLENCTNLVEIIMRFNHLSGDISKLDFSRFVQLQKLDLRFNSFNGTLPESIYSCKSLVAIGVAANNIAGQISSRIAGLKSLSYLSLANNNFTNITATLRALAKCKNLKTLLLGSNFYGEPLPTSVNFTSLDEFPKLEYFNLGYCNFGSPIPDWLSKLKGLRYLSMAGNNMTGTLPNWLGALPNLIFLHLFNNSLTGNIPFNICQLQSLVSPTANALHYFHFDLPTFTHPFSTSHMNQDGSIFGALTLSYNALSGNIPSEIGNLINLQYLVLDHNHFYGHIPMSISSLKNLEYLYLSDNDLTGGIPTSLERLSFMSEFDVSYNNLQGPIPTGGQFSTFPESSFEGNPGLCGEPLNHSCFTVKRSGPEERVTKTSHFSKKAFLDGLYVGFGSGFSVVIAIVTPFFWLKYYRRIGPC